MTKQQQHTYCHRFLSPHKTDPGSINSTRRGPEALRLTSHLPVVAAVLLTVVVARLTPAAAAGRDDKGKGKEGAAEDPADARRSASSGRIWNEDLYRARDFLMFEKFLRDETKERYGDQFQKARGNWNEATEGLKSAVHKLLNDYLQTRDESEQKATVALAEVQDWLSDPKKRREPPQLSDAGPQVLSQYLSVIRPHFLSSPAVLKLIDERSLQTFQTSYPRSYRRALRKVLHHLGEKQKQFYKELHESYCGALAEREGQCSAGMSRPRPGEEIDDDEDDDDDDDKGHDDNKENAGKGKKKESAEAAAENTTTTEPRGVFDSGIGFSFAGLTRMFSRPFTSATEPPPEADIASESDSAGEDEPRPENESPPPFMNVGPSSPADEPVERHRFDPVTPSATRVTVSDDDMDLLGTRGFRAIPEAPLDLWLAKLNERMGPKCSRLAVYTAALSREVLKGGLPDRKSERELRSRANADYHAIVLPRVGGHWVAVVLQRPDSHGVVSAYVHDSLLGYGGSADDGRPDVYAPRDGERDSNEPIELAAERFAKLLFGAELDVERNMILYHGASDAQLADLQDGGVFALANILPYADADTRKTVAAPTIDSLRAMCETHRRETTPAPGISCSANSGGSSSSSSSSAGAPASADKNALLLEVQDMQLPPDAPEGIHTLSAFVKYSSSETAPGGCGTVTWPVQDSTVAPVTKMVCEPRDLSGTDAKLFVVLWGQNGFFVSGSPVPLSELRDGVTDYHMSFTRPAIACLMGAPACPERVGSLSLRLRVRLTMPRDVTKRVYFVSTSEEAKNLWVRITKAAQVASEAPFAIPRRVMSFLDSQRHMVSPVREAPRTVHSLLRMPHVNVTGVLASLRAVVQPSVQKLWWDTDGSDVSKNRLWQRVRMFFLQQLPWYDEDDVVVLGDLGLFRKYLSDNASPGLVRDMLEYVDLRDNVSPLRRQRESQYDRLNPQELEKAVTTEGAVLSATVHYPKDLAYYAGRLPEIKGVQDIAVLLKPSSDVGPDGHRGARPTHGGGMSGSSGGARHRETFGRDRTRA